MYVDPWAPCLRTGVLAGVWSPRIRRPPPRHGVLRRSPPDFYTMTPALSFDTSPDASDVQLTAWRAMTPAQRLLQAAALSRAVLLLEREGLRRRHPSLSAAELHWAAVERRLGPELSARVRSALQREP